MPQMVQHIPLWQNYQRRFRMDCPTQSARV